MEGRGEEAQVGWPEEVAELAVQEAQVGSIPVGEYSAGVEVVGQLEQGLQQGAGVRGRPNLVNVVVEGEDPGLGLAQFALEAGLIRDQG